MNRFFRSSLFPLFVIVLLVYLASQTLIPHSKSAKKVTYSEFLNDSQKGDVANVNFTPSKRSNTGTIPSQNDKKFTGHYASEQFVPQITDILQSEHIQFDFERTGSSSWISFFTSLLQFVRRLGLGII